MSKTVNTKILLRNDTAARWTSENPVLGKGEIGVEIDTTKFKFGDGITAWNSLPYASGADIDLANASKNGLLSKEDFVKLQNIETGAEVNVIETVKRNGVALTPDGNKAVDVIVPTRTSDLTNDSGYITIEDVPEGAAASTTTPLMDGTASTGTEKAFARGDHRHPTDTSRAAASDLTALTTRVATIETDTTTGLPSKADKATSLSGYGIADAYTKTEIDGKLASAMHYKGTKATVAEVQALTGMQAGDVWHVTADGSEWAYNGSSWEELGTVIDLSAYATQTWVTNNFATAAQGALADSALQSASIAGLSISKNSNTITKTALQQALDIDNLDYSKVTASNTNGNIKVDGSEMTVYTLPATVLHSTDTLLLNCGDSTTNYQ